MQTLPPPTVHAAPVHTAPPPAAAPAPPDSLHRVHAAPIPEEFYLPPGDNLRMLGALIDIVISVGFVALMFVIGGLLGDRIDGPLGLLVFPGCWLLDILAYAVPLSRRGWSIGNLLTRRRVVDRATWEPVSLWCGVKRYFVRRVAGFFLRNALIVEVATGRARQFSRADNACGTAVVSTRIPQRTFAELQAVARLSAVG